MMGVYTYQYDTAYHPPIPVVDLAVGLPLDDTFVELTAIVDSGADATIISLRYLRRLGARRSRKAFMRGVTGEQALIDLYAVAIRFGPYHQGFLEVVGMKDSHETIIGRDVLNQLAVTLNGPGFVVELSSEL